MKKLRTMAVFAAAVLLLALGGCLLYTRSGPQPAVTGKLRPEDPLQIQQVVSSYRWTMLRESVADRDVKFFLSRPFFHAMSGRVREIGAMPDRPIHGWGQSVTNPSCAAYGILAGRHSQHSLRYHLKLTTNGWAVVPPMIYQ